MHIQDHCKTPRTTFRKVGSIWGCNCGKLYRLSYMSSDMFTIKVWELVK